LLNYIIELVPENLDFTEEITRIIGFSAVTSVNLDPIPKTVNKGEKVRYEGFTGLEETLKTQKATPEYISTLKFIHDKINHAFTDLIQVNYTPNFITFTCKFPKGRSKTFLFIRFKRNNVQFEFSGQSVILNVPEDFSSELMDKLKAAFNNLSEKQI
jgi:hypothetical protein